MFSEMASCTWDPDSGTLTTARKADERKNLTELEKASWYKNAFEDIGTVKQCNPKPPPELLFNLDEDRSIKTIHLRNEARLSLKEGGSQPLQKKLIDKVVQPMSSDEESASHLAMKGRVLPPPMGSSIPPPLVPRTTFRLQMQPMAYSCHQLPSLVHREGTATGVKWSVSIQTQDQ
jgi:hypothetical protein